MALPKRAQLAPKAIIAHAKCSAQIDDYVASQIEADGPGLALAIVVSGDAGWFVRQIARRRQPRRTPMRR
jgi:hypothetical protein